MFSSWESLHYLETEPTARTFLTERYRMQGVDHPERFAYQHCTRFVYTWLQARTYYQSAAQADLLIRPLLLFYGYTQMIKGCILANDPHYPQNSRMLQHGVATRKMKKSPYRLLEDDIRPQKEGLFAHAAHLWNLSPLQDRYKVSQLFAWLAELAPDFTAIVRPSEWVPIQFEKNGSLLLFPCTQSGTLTYSSSTFLHYLNRVAPPAIRFHMDHDGENPGQPLAMRASSPECLHIHPLFSVFPDKTISFWNGAEKEIPLPAWAIHFLLLYLLGMLCRYETEWWGELVLTHSLAEILLIEKFLTLHMNVSPRIIGNLLAGGTVENNGLS